MSIKAEFGLGWLFGSIAALAIVYLTSDHEKTEQQIRETTRLQVGRVEPCITEVALSTWEAMNELSIYSWVAACEAEHDR